MLTYKLEKGFVVPCPADEGNIRVVSAGNEQDRREMFQFLDFKKYDLESSLDPDEISRIEFEEDHTFIIVKRPKPSAVMGSIRFDVASVGIFLKPESLTFVVGEGKIEFGARPFSPACGLMDVVLRFLSITVHHYLSHLKAIKMITAELQAQINASMENKYLIQMFSLVESLIYYTNSIESNEAVLVKLKVMAGKMGLTDIQGDYLGDIILENQQCIKQATIYSSVLSGLMDARGTIINNNVNVLLKKLTTINIVFLPLNLLAGIGGMSEFTMMTVGVPWWIAYPLFVIGMVLLGWLGWVLLARLLDRPPPTLRR